jgi:DNA topoisomerase-1
VSDALVGQFPSLFDVKFTARMEGDLDTIATGNSTYLKVLQGFYRPFQRSLKEAGVGGAPVLTGKDKRQRLTKSKASRTAKGAAALEAKQGEALDAPAITCDKCGAPMVLRSGKNGNFYGCSTYPTCRNTKPVPTGVKCPQCKEGDIVERTGGRYSAVFYGCSRYPECRYTSSEMPENAT